MSSLRRAVLSALSAGAMIAAVTATAVPASAAVRPVGAADAGQILCSGDYLCVQTISVDQVACTAVVATWANKKDLPGHFELIVNGDTVLNSPTRVWPAGGTNHKFTVDISEIETPVEAIAWSNATGTLLDVGHIDFTINAVCL
jgi:hypothetical protein